MTEILIGFVSGIITSFGMGGGAILILLLTLFLKISQITAQATNLIFFIPTALIATFINFKQKNIDYKSGNIIAICGIIGAIIGANIAMKMETNLKKYFAIFLLIIAICETFSYFKDFFMNKLKMNENNNKKIDNIKKQL